MRVPYFFIILIYKVMFVKIYFIAIYTFYGYTRQLCWRKMSVKADTIASYI